MYILVVVVVVVLPLQLLLSTLIMMKSLSHAFHLTLIISTKRVEETKRVLAFRKEKVNVYARVGCICKVIQ